MSPEERRGRALGRALALLIFIGMVLGLAWWAVAVLQTPQGQRLLTAALREVPVTCYVGVKGAAASITVTGVAAQPVCDQMGAQSEGTLYRRSTAPAEPVVCEVAAGPARLVVRDQGILKVVGNTLCAKFGAWK